MSGTGRQNSGHTERAAFIVTFAWAIVTYALAAAEIIFRVLLAVHMGAKIDLWWVLDGADIWVLILSTAGIGFTAIVLDHTAEETPVQIAILITATVVAAFEYAIIRTSVASHTTTGEKVLSLVLWAASAYVAIMQVWIEQVSRRVSKSVPESGLT